MAACIRVGVRLFVVIAVACAAAVAGSGETLEFEDLFGFCGDYDLVRGPGTMSIEGLLFTSPDIYTYNVGKENSFPPGLGNPFESDSYHFFTFGAGATIDFPVSISRLRFTTGERTNMSDWPTFRLIAGGNETATFGANIWTPEFVDVNFPQPVSRVVIQFIQGSSSILGVDSFQYTPATSAVFGDRGVPIAALSLDGPNPNPVGWSGDPVVWMLHLSEADRVLLELFDPSGRKAATLGAIPCRAGENRIAWDAGRLPSGAYVLRASTGRATCTAALVIVR